MAIPVTRSNVILAAFIMFITGTAAFASDLKDETLLQGLPTGESDQAWTEMVTTQIFHNSPSPLEHYFVDMQRSWSGACEGANAVLIRDWAPATPYYVARLLIYAGSPPYSP